MKRSYLGPFCDHLDVRVTDVQRARAFYDPVCAELGLTRIGVGEQFVTYESTDTTAPFLAITAELDFTPSRTRIALRGDSHEHVERVARAAKNHGARRFEAPHLCPEYAEGYYAAFFEDPDGNRYEICYRPLTPTVGRLWRGRVRPQLLDEYRQYVAATGLADYANTDGNRGAFAFTAPRARHGDVLTISLWESLDAIARFAGEPVEKARYYDEDERFLLDFPEWVEHFDVTF
jgi:catechol 2,3-dioxygenase-like lactoylglutathione lyase family enzyme/heme-degrading monooxygenase HmoA